jgi:hypothetical protein
MPVMLGDKGFRLIEVARHYSQLGLGHAANVCLSSILSTLAVTLHHSAEHCGCSAVRTALWAA